MNLTMGDWNPELYLKFGRERIQPTLDLVSRIELDHPQKIIDIGCGPGNSTAILRDRWPDAHIMGVDVSETMIAKAKADYPNGDWRLVDAGKDEIGEMFDLVFSNATIQWIPDHDLLIRKFYRCLNREGVLAVQIPLFWDMSLGQSIRKIGNDPSWKEQTAGITDMFTIHDACFYYDQLSKHFSMIDLWQTDYTHIMASHASILEMIRSTGLRPYLERLNSDEDKVTFEAMVLESIQSDYPLQENGKVLFPFKRLFFIAKT